MKYLSNPTSISFNFDKDYPNDQANGYSISYWLYSYGTSTSEIKNIIYFTTEGASTSRYIMFQTKLNSSTSINMNYACTVGTNFTNTNTISFTKNNWNMYTYTVDINPLTFLTFCKFNFFLYNYKK